MHASSFFALPTNLRDFDILYSALFIFQELDVKAGGGCTMTIGSMLEHWLTKLDWFTTLFPRIPVPVQKKLDEKLRLRRCQAMLQNPPAHSQPTEVRRPISQSVRDSEEDDRRRRHGHSLKSKHG